MCRVFFLLISMMSLSDTNKCALACARASYRRLHRATHWQRRFVVWLLVAAGWCAAPFYFIPLWPSSLVWSGAIVQISQAVLQYDANEQNRMVASMPFSLARFYTKSHPVAQSPIRSNVNKYANRSHTEHLSIKYTSSNTAHTNRERAKKRDTRTKHISFSAT